MKTVFFLYFINLKCYILKRTIYFWSLNWQQSLEMVPQHLVTQLAKPDSFGPSFSFRLVSTPRSTVFPKIFFPDATMHSWGTKCIQFWVKGPFREEPNDIEAYDVENFGGKPLNVESKPFKIRESDQKHPMFPVEGPNVFHFELRDHF